LKILSILIASMLFYSCSPESPLPSKNVKKTNEIISMEELSYDVFSDSWDVSSVDIVATIGDKVEQVIQVTNRGRSTISLGSSSLSGFGSELSMDSSSCDGVDLRRRQTCYVKLNLDSSSLSEGTINGDLTINGSQIPVVVTINGAVEETSPLTITPTNLDFGEFLIPDTKKSLFLTIYNGTRDTQPVNVGSFVSGNFSIDENTCGASLARRRRCVVTVSYTSPSEITATETITDILSVSGIDVNATAQLVLDVPPEGCTVEEPGWQISRYTDEAGQRVIDLKGKDSVTLIARNSDRSTRSLCIEDNGLDATRVTYTKCDNVGRYRYCYLKFERLNNLVSDHEIMMNGISYIIKTDEPTSLPCEELDSQTNGYDISLYETIIGEKSVDGLDVTQCSMTCPTGYTLDGAQKACVKSCEEADAILNTVNIAQVIDYKGQVVGSDVSQCLINSCNTGYIPSANEKACEEEADLRTVVITLDNNGANLYNWKNIQTQMSTDLTNADGQLIADNCTGQELLVNGPTCEMTLQYDYKKSISTFGLLNTTTTVNSLTYVLQSQFTITADINPEVRDCIAADIDAIGGRSSNALTFSGQVTETLPTPDRSQCKIATCDNTYQLSVNQLSCLKESTFTINKTINQGGVNSSNNNLDLSVSELTKNTTVLENDSISFVASNGTEYVFDKWTGDYCNNSTSNTCNVTIGIVNASLTANYNPKSCSTISDIQTTEPSLDTTGISSSGISGDYVNGCIYSCSTGYVENTTNPNIACDEDILPPTVNFNIQESYTRYNTNRSITISGTYIDQVKIWQGNTCSGTVVQDWTSSIPTSINLYADNSNNVFSVKAKNSKGEESSCDSDNVIHDNIPPTIQINSQNLSGNSVNINWTANDANFDRTYYYQGSSYKGNTSSITNSYNFTGLSFGSNGIRLNPRDRAGNAINEWVYVDYDPAPTNIQVLEGDSGVHINITVRVYKLSGTGVRLYKDSSCTQLIDTSTSNSSSYQNFSVEVGYTYGMHYFYAKQYNGAVESDCSTVFDSYESIEPVAGDRACTAEDAGFNSGDFLMVSGTVYDDGRGNLSNNTCSIECIFGSQEMGSSPNKYCTNPYPDDKIVNAGYNAIAILKNNGTLQTFGDVDKGGNRPSTVASGVKKVKAVGESGFVALKTNGTIVAWGESVVTNQLNNLSTTNIKDIETTKYNSSITILKNDGTIESTESNFNVTSANTSPVKSIHANDNTVAALYENGNYGFWGGTPGTDRYDRSYNRPIHHIYKGENYFIFLQGTNDFGGYDYGAGNNSALVFESSGSAPVRTHGRYYGFIPGGRAYTYISNQQYNPISYYGEATGSEDGSIIAYGGDFVSIMATRSSFAAHKSDGRMWIWGNQSYGGRGSYNNYNVPEQQNQTTTLGITEAKAGRTGIIAKYADGSAKMWSGGSYPFTFETVRSISASNDCLAVISTTNTFYAKCGNMTGSFKAEISNVSTMYSMEVGFLLKKTNGTYEFWRDNNAMDYSLHSGPLSGISDSGGITENK
jgi:hypothetical protein